MRKLTVLTLCGALAGCAIQPVIHTGKEVYIVPSPEPALPNAIRPGAERLMAVERVYVWCAAGKLRLRVWAFANSGGWSEPRLSLISSAGRYLLYQAVAQRPPPGQESDRQDSFVIEHETEIPQGLSAVKVISQSNEMIAALGPSCS